VRPYVDPGQRELLAAELKFLTGFAKVRMPRGAIHGDLFCDNVLFVGDRVSASSISASPRRISSPTISRSPSTTGASPKPESGALVPELVRARRSVRRRAAASRGRTRAVAGAAARRRAALLAVDGSTISHLPRPGELVHAHDPAHFERILRHRIDNRVWLPERVDAPARLGSRR
jgi:homoserine kinase type II